MSRKNGEKGRRRIVTPEYSVKLPTDTLAEGFNHDTAHCNGKKVNAKGKERQGTYLIQDPNGLMGRGVSDNDSGGHIS